MYRGHVGDSIYGRNSTKTSHLFVFRPETRLVATGGVDQRLQHRL